MINKKSKRVASAGDAPVEKAGNLLPDVGKEPMFYEQKNGRGFTYRIANMNNPIVCRRKGIVRIEAIHKGKFKQADVRVSNYFDPKLRVWFGVPTGIDDNGNIIWKRFHLGEFKEYNLANDDEAVEFAVVSRHTIMTGSRKLYRVYDVEADAKAEIAIIGLIDEAVSIAKGMKIQEWIDTARFFGKSAAGMSPVMLQSEVYKIARNTPNELIDYWNDSNRDIINVFNAAKSVGIISFDYATGWMYEKTMPLGSTEQAAMKYIKQDPVLAKGIQQKCKERDKAAKAVMSRSQDESGVQVFENQESTDVIELQMKAKLLGVENFEVMEMDELKQRVKEAEDNTDLNF